MDSHALALRWGKPFGKVEVRAPVKLWMWGSCGSGLERLIGKEGSHLNGAPRWLLLLRWQALSKGFLWGKLSVRWRNSGPCPLVIVSWKSSTIRVAAQGNSPGKGWLGEHSEGSCMCVSVFFLKMFLLGYRQEKKQIFHLLLHSPNAQNKTRQGLELAEARPVNFTQVFHGGARNESTCIVIHCIPDN